MKSKLLILLMLFPLLLFAQGKRPLVWVIDAGHGGHDQGTKGKNITEKEINLKVSQEVVRLIRKH
ncbi:MAG: N-acetylmuramoyl-L-alanine amidase, partial [Bacteroidaceae bacterium]|nr:N-acetylmuramoyl-L-alanine amidase [Bacteroidaceae bacterium]